LEQQSHKLFTIAQISMISESPALLLALFLKSDGFTSSIFFASSDSFKFVRYE
jgi:hypothetical protein